MEEFLKGMTPQIYVTKLSNIAEISRFTVVWVRIGSQDFCCEKYKNIIPKRENASSTTNFATMMDPNKSSHEKKEKEIHIH